MWGDPAVFHQFTGINKAQEASAWREMKGSCSEPGYLHTEKRILPLKYLTAFFEAQCWVHWPCFNLFCIEIEHLCLSSLNQSILLHNPACYCLTTLVSLSSVCVRKFSSTPMIQAADGIRAVICPDFSQPNHDKVRTVCCWHVDS